MSDEPPKADNSGRADTTATTAGSSSASSTAGASSTSSTAGASSSAGADGADGSKPKRRRRRRRKRPDGSDQGAGGDASSDSAAASDAKPAQAGGQSRGRRPADSQSRGGTRQPKSSDGGSETRPRRRRRRGGAERGGAPRGGAERGGAERGGAERGGAERGGAERGGAERGGAAERGVAERSSRDRGGRDRGGAERGAAGATREPGRKREGGGPQRRQERGAAVASRATEAPPSGADIDAGWNDEAPGSAAQAPPSSELDRDFVDTSIDWGNDRDAPTPEVQLAPDLPVDDPDEHDPSTAPPQETSPSSEDNAATTSGSVRNVVGVKFQSAGKIYLYSAGDDSYRKGEEVMVQSDRGPRIGIVGTDSLRRSHNRGQLKKILRRPDYKDRRVLERNSSRERTALLRAREVVRALELPVKVFRAELAHSGKKARIYFTSEERVDFRDLVRDLSAALHLRIEMRQTGVRDQAKLVGGIGSCGQELCCTTWLPEFVPVSIKHAKDQGLVLNPTKVSGQCGRLKCCLVYEQSLYAELRKGLPKLGKRVVTEIGEGRVVEVDVLRQRVRVSHVTGDVALFTKDEVKPMFPSQTPSPRKKT